LNHIDPKRLQNRRSTDGGSDVMKMDNFGSSLIYGHPQGLIVGRAIIEMIEELALLGEPCSVYRMFCRRHCSLIDSEGWLSGAWRSSRKAVLASLMTGAFL
jgi:hypothetical protein